MHAPVQHCVPLWHDAPVAEQVVGTAHIWKVGLQNPVTHSLFAVQTSPTALLPVGAPPVDGPPPADMPP
ncbi:MAG TPA: hypothetical protein VGJ84_16110 [Polyangiaceae bacterium]